MSEQLDLWNRPSLNPVSRVKAAMRQALKGCGLSREQVVDDMNRFAQHEGLATNGRAGRVTVDLLEKWVAASGEHLISWKLLPIFCLVTKELAPLRALAAPLGAEVIESDEATLLEWARLEVEGRKLRRRKRRLEEDINL